MLKNRPVPKKRKGARDALAFIFLAARRHMVLSVGLLFVGGLAGTIVPLLTAWALNDGLLANPSDMGVLANGVLLSTAGYLIVAAADSGRSYAAFIAGARAAGALREKLFISMLSGDIAFHRSGHTGDRVSRLVNDAASIATVPLTVIDKILGGVISAAAALIAMIALSPQLTLIAFALTLPIVFLMRGISRQIETRTVGLFSSMSILQQTIADLLTADHVLLAKIYGKESDSARRLHDASAGEVDSSIQLRRAGLRTFAFISALMLSGPVLLYLFVGYLGGLDALGLQAGTLIAFTGLHARLPFVVTGLLSTATHVRATRTVLLSVMNAEDRIASRPVTKVRSLVANDVRLVELRGLTFAHDGQPPLFCSLDLNIDRGDRIRIAGDSGSGKSTLARLIVGVESPTGGVVAHARCKESPSVVDLVPQDSYFFPGSLRENLSYAMPSASDDELWEALAVTQLAGKVRQLPDGLGTKIGNGGLTLSGGEKQRLALARAVLRDADVIILDEATNAIDADTEDNIVLSLLERWHTKGIVLITHQERDVFAKFDPVRLGGHAQETNSGAS